jgi:alkanesulfonate monooxygenase SsuD/methylene tetrahydromethanopterin reductase-like flavin-dependent oxidoreductase (luciferase family)
MLVKDAASVQALSGGRLTLGLAVGAREDDYDAAKMPHKGRGARLSDQLGELRDWRDSPVVPAAVRDTPPELLVGGLSPAAYTRMARYGDGYAHNGGPPRAFEGAAAKARAAWSDLGRPGEPALWGQAYFALGDEPKGEAYLLDYYAFTGPFAAKIAAGTLTSPRAIRDFVRAYEEAGCDELVLLPTVSDIGQLERLADAL